MAARVVVVVELRGVAVGDPLGQAAAVLLGAGGLRDRARPSRAGRSDRIRRSHMTRATPAGWRPSSRSSRVRRRLRCQRSEYPARSRSNAPAFASASISVIVAERQTVRAAVGDLEHQPGVDEAVALDEAVLLLALARRAVAVVLAGGRLADPARDAQAPDVVERAGQALDGTGCLTPRGPSRSWPSRTPSLCASRPSRRIWSGPPG